MNKTLLFYLNTIKSRLRLDPLTERDFLREILSHLQEKIEELRRAGYSEEEATEKVTLSLGAPEVIAEQMYQAHSRGTWLQAALAAMPHVFFALFFALSLWQNPVWWLASILAILFIVAAYGWRHGKPAWLFPWLGYSLVPVIIAGILLLSLPQGWGYLAILVYLPFALWLILSILFQTVKRDWLFASLMLLPLPAVAGWLVALGRHGWFHEDNKEFFLALAPWIALSFLALAVTAATFIRLSRRKLKTSALLTPELLILVMVALASKGELSFPWFAVLVLLSLAFILSPALLEHKIGHGDWKVESWDGRQPSGQRS